MEAETRQTQINTLLNAIGQLPEEVITKQICSILDLNFDEVQALLKENRETRKSINGWLLPTKYTLYKKDGGFRMA